MKVGSAQYGVAELEGEAGRLWSSPLPSLPFLPEKNLRSREREGPQQARAGSCILQEHIIPWQKRKADQCSAQVLALHPCSGLSGAPHLGEASAVVGWTF